MKIAIVKYNAGNVQSVLFALERLGVEAVWTDDPDELRSADRVIFPGVGEASSAMRYLRERGLDEVIRSLQQPVLGICLGLQLFCRYSEENDTTCLGIFDTDVRLFPSHLTSHTPHLKVPHMGWNNLSHLRGALFEGVMEESFVYFVHSYYAEISPATVAATNYGVDFSAALQRDNFYAVQFHPEKSGPVGQQILRNFLKIK
ncbi:MAG: imidazole glycerol phosphate synthase subunit HisH [Saprospiraceae bacterium]